MPRRNRNFESSGSWLNRQMEDARLENLEDLYQLSPMQQGMLFHTIYAPESGAYFEQSVFTIKGELHLKAFERAWQRIVERHSIFRSSFLWEELENPVQVVHRQAHLRIDMEDWSNKPAALQTELLEEFLANDRRQGFDFAVAPLVRLALFRLSSTRYNFIFSRHHLVLDRWSRAIVLKELFALYDAFSRGEELTLEQPRPYGDYIAWLGAQNPDTAQSYWKRSLAGLSGPTELTVDRKPMNAALEGQAFDKERIQLSESTTARLRDFARDHKLTLNTLTKAAWAILLSRYSGNEDVLFGVTVSGRPPMLSGVESMVGLLVNTLPQRVQVPSSSLVLPWLEGLQQQQGEMQQFEYSSLLDIQGWSDIPRGTPLFKSIFVFENLPVASSVRSENGRLAINNDRGIGSTTGYPLTVLVTPGTKLTVQVVYDCARFDPESVRRMLGHFQNLLEHLPASEEGRISSLPLLMPAERDEIIVEWNKTAADYPHRKCWHTLFEEQVGRFPESVAIECEGELVTYAALNERANQLARYLVKRGVGPEVLVGICMERSIEMVIGLMAILKAGGAYVPLDPTYPRERLRFMVRDARLRILLTQEQLLRSIPAEDVETICLDHEWGEISQEVRDNPSTNVSGINLAYLIYTSGSTGKPKGVAIEHRSTVALINWTEQTFSREELAGVVASTSICFDLSIFELFVPLSRGGSVILVEDALQLSSLQSRIKARLINTVPSAMAELLRLGGLPDTVQTVNLAGEPLKPSLVDQIHREPGVKRVLDLYGPSEDTTYSTFALRLPHKPATIGRPVSNTRLYILDPSMSPVPIGVPGELYIGGRGLARGYFNRPELTAEKFLPDPFGDKNGARLYRTGDLARYHSDGNVEYLGRVDQQVKIRGYRIELEEIEAVINQHHGVREAVVMAREDHAEDRRLVAYVVHGRKDTALEPDVKEDWHNEQVSQWQAVWDETYREIATPQEASFNIVGWNSSYTGGAIPAEEMRQWVEHTVERIVSLRPRRVLEIGCGTGLLMFRIAPHCESYRGTDLSKRALDYLRHQLPAAGAALQKVELSEHPADHFDGLSTGAFDTVILNSVVQYFPSIDYLVLVLEGAVKAVKNGGAVFLGDLRSLPLLEAFHTSVQLHHAPLSLSLNELRERAHKQLSQEKELLIDPRFFNALKRYLPRINRVEVQLKRGRYRNELTKFRYDVTLHISDESIRCVEGPWFRWHQDILSVERLRQFLLESKPELIGITEVPNARLAEEVKILELIASAEGPANVGELRRALRESNLEGAAEPEDLWALAAELGYACEIKWGSAGGWNCDLVLRQQDVPVVELASAGQWREEARTGDAMWNRYANNPLQAEIARSLIPDLRRLLTEKLPEHMMPSAFVLLDTLPLTASGKIDRKALPAPGESRPELEAAYVPPSTPLEETLATIWGEVLKLKQIGIHDNFFELGGHSLLATQLVSRIRRAFNVELPLRRLFESPTIAELATVLSGWQQESKTHPALSLSKSESDPRELLVSTDQPSDEEVDSLLNDMLAGLGEDRIGSVQPVGTELSIDEKRALLADLLRERGAKGRTVAVSFAQQRLWFLDQLEPGSSSYNVSRAARMRGRLNVPALRQTVNALVARHESLRTNFGSVEGEPVQIVFPSREAELCTIDLKGLEFPERETEARRLALVASQRPFDLAQDQLLRVSLFQLDEQDHVLSLVMHHIISDGWSMGVLLREIRALYEACANNRPCPLPRLPIQYPDFALWQRQRLQGELLEKQLEYWKRQLAGAPAVLSLPTDRPRPAMQTTNGAQYSRDLPGALCDSINELSRREGATLFMTLLAAFQTLLYRYTNQEDIVVGTPIANRTRRETEDLIGFFVNTLAMRVDLSGDPPFRELLRRVKEVSLEAYGHQDLPFEKLVEELNPERSLSHAPLFQVMIVLQNAPREAQKLSELTITSLPVESGTAKFDLTLFVSEGLNGITSWLEYNTDLFYESTIARMLEHFEILLEAIVADPDRRLSRLPLLSKAERRLLLSEWNDTRFEFTQQNCLHLLFEQQVERTPDSIAVVYEAQQFTYAELNSRANQLAHHLRKRGVGSDAIVGLCFERSLDLVVGLVGILKAGAAYLPLDLSYPPERLSFMLKDAAVKVLLTQERLREKLPDHGAETISLDGDWEAIASESQENAENRSSSDNLAYVIYTSGSTGQPKGVAMTHHALANLLSWQVERAGAFPAARTLQFASLSFDVSFQEMFSTWSTGGTLVLVSEELRRDALALLNFLERQAIERIFVPFVYLQHLAEVFEPGGSVPQFLRDIITAGEQLEITPQIAHFCSALKDSRLYNHYGPSESHVVTAHLLAGPPENWPTLPPIGRPISNTQIYILDQYLQPLPIGVSGELCIGGASLSRGYHNRPDLTAMKFLPDPFSDQSGGRIYLTGDLARYREDGNIQFLGRIDSQVKIRGFRVELGEIETLLATHPGVREVAVVAREDEIRDRKLVAYVVADPKSREALGHELRTYLKQKLPDYMIPTAFVSLQSLPLTPSGKINRRALPAIDPNEIHPAQHYEAPRTPVEEKLAEIWSLVLKRESIGIRDNFFDLGGHSLLATQLMSRVRSAFQVELPLRHLFESPTVAELATAVLDFEKSADSRSPLPITRDTNRDAQDLLVRIDQLTNEQVTALLNEALAETGEVE